MTDCYLPLAQTTEQEAVGSSTRSSVSSQIASSG